MNSCNFNPYTGNSFTRNYWDLRRIREKLPVYKYKTQFLNALDLKQCILMEAETGSGKTTQVPQWCVEWLHKNSPNQRHMVCCTQPRRLATVGVAQRVASEMDVKLGQEVGYSIRFEDVVSYQTRLKYCTDGVLLAESTRSHLLEQYRVVILDEVHERTMTTDVLLGLVKIIMKHRKDLRVVVMSASLNTGNFAKYFSGSFVLQIPGRSFPVKIIYTDWDITEDSYQEKAIEKVIEIHKKEKEGDILLFLTGQEEIEIACEKLELAAAKINIFRRLIPIPLYATLQHDQQRKILEPQVDRPANTRSGRRCIVATNVAETSMTIDGIVFVVDPGFYKRKFYDPRTKIESLLVHRICRVSATQRAGRAGRTQPGKCFRLYTEHLHDKMMAEIDPEITRSNLDNVVLRLKKCGISDLFSFELMDAPHKDLILQAQELLINLGALDVNGHITPLGAKISDLPVDPMLARMMIESVHLGCAEEVAIICAMLSSPNCFVRPRKKQELADQARAQFTSDLGDHITLLRVYQEFVNLIRFIIYIAGRDEQWCYQNFLNFRSLQYADAVYNQLVNVMLQRLNMEVISSTIPSDLHLHHLNILKALVAGSFLKVAYFQPTLSMLSPARNGFYVIVENQISSNSGRTNTLPNYLFHPSSVLFKSTWNGPRPEWVLFHEALKLKGNKHYLSQVSVIRPEWLPELVPATYFSRISPLSALGKKFAQIRKDYLQGLARRLETMY